MRGRDKESRMARILFMGDGGAPVEEYRKGLSGDFHQLVAFEGTDDLQDRIERSRAEVILVDLDSLLRGNRGKLFDYLRSPPAAQTIPVIVLTDSEASAVSSLSSAFVLSKPVPMQKLRDAVYRALQACRAQPIVVRVPKSDQVCAGQVAPQERSKSAGLFQEPGEPICPFFKKATADWLYPVTGYCQGRADGKLMIPSITDYRESCTTEQFRCCANYQTKRQRLDEAVA
jgi:CheY-like chemotaxis protein